MHRTLYKIHSWAGLLAGLALLLVALSGSVLVFNEEISHYLYPERLTVAPVGERHSLDACYRLVRTRYPQLAYVSPDRLVSRPEESVAFRGEAGGVQYRAYVNPYTLEILYFGERYAQAMDWLLLFHYSLAGGKAGELLVALLGLALLLSVVTGLYLYRRSILPVLLFQVRINRKNWRTLSSGLHRVVGVWSLLFNLLIAGTGFWMMRYTFSSEQYDGTFEQQPQPIPLRFSLDNALQTIRNRYPDLEVTYMFLPRQPGEAVFVYGSMHGRSFLYGDYGDELSLDPQTGAIQSTRLIGQKTLGEKLESMVFPLHAGMFGHWTIKIAYSLLGLMPGLLSVTGFLLWWRRKNPKGGRKAVSRAPYAHPDTTQKRKRSPGKVTLSR